MRYTRALKLVFYYALKPRPQDVDEVRGYCIKNLLMQPGNVIAKRDLVGYSIPGAMCNAVKRGVDVRIMVDGLGSMHPGHSELRALETCAEYAGFMRNDAGEMTTKKARVQVVIFNAFSKFQESETGFLMGILLSQ